MWAFNGSSIATAIPLFQTCTQINSPTPTNSLSLSLSFFLVHEAPFMIALMSGCLVKAQSLIHELS